MPSAFYLSMSMQIFALGMQNFSPYFALKKKNFAQIETEPLKIYFSFLRIKYKAVIFRFESKIRDKSHLNMTFTKKICTVHFNWQGSMSDVIRSYRFFTE
ncbi:Uncharacterised protein [Neisseria animaloris]|uniref:Uncharacterized protein n=1 Tax=Neisseria animaloris TaxID=326522 RepID=A0A448UCX0_9NEIS|nr:Uncharacterised protein [Neisseria animaloris]